MFLPNINLKDCTNPEGVWKPINGLGLKVTPVPERGFEIWRVRLLVQRTPNLSAETTGVTLLGLS